MYVSIKHVNETLANRYTYCRVCSTGTKVQLVIVEEVIQHVLLICVPKIILAMAHVAVEGIKPPTGWEVAFITESEVPPFSKKGISDNLSMKKCAFTTYWYVKEILLANHVSGITLFF